MEVNLLITGAMQLDQSRLNMLYNMGINVDFHQQEKEIIKCPDKYDAVICNGLFLYNDINRFSRLKYIQLTSAGMDRISLEYTKEHNIRVHNARGVYSIPMAEYAVMKILEIYKNCSFFYRNQVKHKWIKNRDIMELYGKTVCVFGCGNIGIEVAKRLKAFGTKIIGVDIACVSCEYIDEIVLMDKADEFLSASDIVVLTLPLTSETKGMFGYSKFNKMKKDAVFINMSRGTIVKEVDLIRALENKEILGAALDVFEEEPLNNQSPLWDMENVIITPHNSFIGEGNNDRMFNVMYNNLKDWMRKDK